MWRFVWLVPLTLVLGCGGGPKSPLERAEMQFKQGDFNEALASIDQAIKADGSSFQQHVLRGQILKNLAADAADSGDTSAQSVHLKNAVTSFSKAIELAPKEASPYFFRADAYKSLGQPKLAFADQLKGDERSIPGQSPIRPGGIISEVPEFGDRKERDPSDEGDVDSFLVTRDATDKAEEAEDYKTSMDLAEPSTPPVSVEIDERGLPLLSIDRTPALSPLPNLSQSVTATNPTSLSFTVPNLEFDSDEYAERIRRLMREKRDEHLNRETLPGPSTESPRPESPRKPNTAPSRGPKPVWNHDATGRPLYGFGAGQNIQSPFAQPQFGSGTAPGTAGSTNLNGGFSNLGTNSITPGVIPTPNVPAFEDPKIGFEARIPHGAAPPFQYGTGVPANYGPTAAQGLGQPGFPGVGQPAGAAGIPTRPISPTTIPTSRPTGSFPSTAPKGLPNR